MGGVAARLFIGKFMDSAGPRMAFLLCLWGTVPFIIGISFVKSFAAYAACRFFMAMALATVIPCIQWTTMMCVAALRQSSRPMSCMRRAKKRGVMRVGGLRTRLSLAGSPTHTALHPPPPVCHPLGTMWASSARLTLWLVVGVTW